MFPSYIRRKTRYNIMQILLEKVKIKAEYFILWFYVSSTRLRFCYLTRTRRNTLNEKRGDIQPRPWRIKRIHWKNRKGVMWLACFFKNPPQPRGLPAKALWVFILVRRLYALMGLRQTECTLLFSGLEMSGRDKGGKGFGEGGRQASPQSFARQHPGHH